MSFAGMDAHVFQGHVLFHTARIAWEAGKFDMQNVPRAWRRGVVEVKVQGKELGLGPRTLSGKM
jgi:hypothetical protein